MPDTKVTSSKEEIKVRVFMVFVFRVCVWSSARVAAGCQKSLVVSLFVAVGIARCQTRSKRRGAA